MKLPGMGEVSNKNVAIGAGVIGGIVLFAYWKKKKAIPVSDGSTVDPNAIDPATGIPYGQEAGSGGGYYTNSSVPNPYVNQTSTAGTTGQMYTSNAAWLLDAEQYATDQFGVSYLLATSAFGKYLAQSPGGLSPDEYQAVSEVVALIGPPPTGTHRLIQATPSQNPSTTPPGHTPEPDEHPTTATPPALFSAEWAKLHDARRDPVPYSDADIARLRNDPFSKTVLGDYVGEIRNATSSSYNIWDGHAWWNVYRP